MRHLYCVCDNCTVYVTTVLCMCQLYCVCVNCTVYVTTVLCMCQLYYCCDNCAMYTTTVLCMLQLYCVWNNCTMYVTTVLCTYAITVLYMWQLYYVCDNCTIMWQLYYVYKYAFVIRAMTVYTRWSFSVIHGSLFNIILQMTKRGSNSSKCSVLYYFSLLSQLQSTFVSSRDDEQGQLNHSTPHHTTTQHNTTQHNLLSMYIFLHKHVLTLLTLHLSGTFLLFIACIIQWWKHA